MGQTNNEPPEETGEIQGSAHGQTTQLMGKATSEATPGTTAPQQQQRKNVWYDSDSSSDDGDGDREADQRGGPDSDDDSDDSDSHGGDGSGHIHGHAGGLDEEDGGSAEQQRQHEDIECDRVAPLYLSECVEQLYADDRTKSRAALRVIPSFVRAKPGNLGLVAGALMKSLLQLSNRFGMDDFDELRMAALISVTVASPIQAVALLRR
jgi:hypothetical protein